MIGLGSQSQLGIGIAISLNNQFSAQANQINQQLLAMRKNANSALTAAMRDYRNQSAAIAGSATLVAAGFYNAAQEGAKFQHKINQTFIVGGKQLQRSRADLENYARSLSREFTRTPMEISEVMFENIKAGVNKGLEEITRYQVAVAAATDEALQGPEGVGEKLLGITNAMGLRANEMIEIGGQRMTQFARVANAVTAASNATMASVYSIGESMEYFSNSAAVAGMTLEQTLALVGKLSQSKITGSAAGTALNNMVQQLINSVGPFMTPKKKKAFGVLGIDPNQISSMINSGNVFEAISLIDQRSRGLSRVDRLNTFNALFNMRGQRGIVNAFLGGEKSLEDIQKDIQQGIQGDVVMKQSKAMMNDLFSDMKFLSSAFQEFKIAFEKAIAPVMRGVLHVGGKILRVATAILETPVGKVLAGIVAIGAPVVAVMFGLRAAALAATIALTSLGRMAGVGGFKGLMQGGLGMLGGSWAGAAGMGGVAFNKAGRAYVAAGQTVNYGGKVYKAGQMLPKGFTAGGAGGSAFGRGIGSAIGNFFGAGSVAAATSGGAITGALAKVGPWIARIGGFALRWVPVIGWIWTAVELLRGIFGNTEDKYKDETPEQRRARQEYEMFENSRINKRIQGTIPGYEMFMQRFDAAGKGQLVGKGDGVLNQTVVINLDGRTLFNQNIQNKLDGVQDMDFNLTY